MKSLFKENGDWTEEARQYDRVIMDALEPIFNAAVEDGIVLRDIEYLVSGAGYMQGVMRRVRNRRQK